jgi:CheY-like chemotaxis protein
MKSGYSGAEKQALNVMISSNDDKIDALIVQTINNAIGTRFDVSFHFSNNSIEIESRFSSIKIDLFVLAPNNIIFPDDNMPYENRFGQVKELVTRMKSIRKIPIIVLSTIESERELLSVGASEFIQMPFDPDMLMSSIRSYY